MSTIPESRPRRHSKTGAGPSFVLISKGTLARILDCEPAGDELSCHTKLIVLVEGRDRYLQKVPVEIEANNDTDEQVATT